MNVNYGRRCVIYLIKWINMDDNTFSCFPALKIEGCICQTEYHFCLIIEPLEHQVECLVMFVLTLSNLISNLSVGWLNLLPGFTALSGIVNAFVSILLHAFRPDHQFECPFLSSYCYPFFTYTFTRKKIAGGLYSNPRYFRYSCVNGSWGGVHGHQCNGLYYDLGWQFPTVNFILQMCKMKEE